MDVDYEYFWAGWVYYYVHFILFGSVFPFRLFKFSLRKFASMVLRLKAVAVLQMRRLSWAFIHVSGV